MSSVSFPIQSILHAQVWSVVLIQSGVACVADIPPVVWFAYTYTHAPPDAPVVKQRVKLEALHPASAPCSQVKMAHLTNYIFQQGYIAKHLRSKVHWEREREGGCEKKGEKIEEHVELVHVLGEGEGVSEERCLRFVIGESKWIVVVRGRG